jgi:hypothetical protein
MSTQRPLGGSRAADLLTKRPRRYGCSSGSGRGTAACSSQPFDILGEGRSLRFASGVEEVRAAGLCAGIGLHAEAGSGVGNNLDVVVHQNILDHRDRPALVALDDPHPAPSAELVTPGQPANAVVPAVFIRCEASDCERSSAAGGRGGISGSRPQAVSRASEASAMAGVSRSAEGCERARPAWRAAAFEADPPRLESSPFASVDGGVIGAPR